MPNIPPDRPWFKKKRYVIPGVVLGLSLLFSGGDTIPSSVTQTTQAIAPVTTQVEFVAPAKEISPADEALKSEEDVRVEETVAAATLDSSKAAKQEIQPPADAGLSNDNYYINANGDSIHSPAYSDDGIPAGASAQCRDGTYSFSASRRGTCSHHGGVAQWF